ncbi:MAG: hypothetical protein BWY68_00274 [bacterium ADurb.Bin400]|nr:MAG: hypothetical protein BWY68_00274 [bacterium ADurb.Bin400]
MPKFNDEDLLDDFTPNNNEFDEFGDDVVHLGRGKRPYRVERGENGEFKDIKGPIDEADY